MVEEKLENTMFFRLSHNLKAELDTICLLLNCNKSNFVREAIREKIAKECEVNDIDL